MSKSELRAQLIHALRACSPGQRSVASAEICRAIREHPAWSAARLVCAFLPLPSEPQIAELWERESEAAFCFPHVRGDEVVLVRIADPALLRRANWRFDGEDLATAPIADCAEVDVFLVPGLGFTVSGGRLGRGGGYYDRLLARRRPTSTALGLCFPCQLVPELPAEPHDMRMDAVISGSAWLSPAAEPAS